MMMMVTMLRSSAAAAVLVFIYLCHVTANDAPARSRPPGMQFTFRLNRNIPCYTSGRDGRASGTE